MVKCSSCKFYLSTPKGNFGKCRRFPPDATYNGFPTANPTNWCGEWSASRPEEPAPSESR